MAKKRKPSHAKQELGELRLEAEFLGDEWRELLGDGFLEKELLGSESEVNGAQEFEDEMGFQFDSELEALADDEKERAEGSAAKLREEALAIPSSLVKKCTWNAILIKQNVDRAYAIMEEFLPQVKSKASEETYARGTRIRETALALVYTSAIAARSNPPGVLTFREGMAQLYSLRRLLLYSALAQVEKQMVDKGALERIQQGQGAVDAIGDTVALANFFSRSAKHRLKSPIEDSDLKKAFSLARFLYPQINVKGAQKEPLKLTKPVDANVDLRNRMWTLLQEDWNEFYVLATLHFKAQVSEVLPKLHAYARVRAKNAEEAKDIVEALEDLERLDQDEGVLTEDSEVEEEV